MQSHVPPKEPSRARAQMRQPDRVSPKFRRILRHFTRPGGHFRQKTRRFFATFAIYNE
jgi:hypothetical protein